MAVERVSPSDRLRIAVLGDFDGVHTRSWVGWFIERGHDVHVISFYPPSRPVEGGTAHALRPPRANPHRQGASAQTAGRVPRGLVRLAQAARYAWAGLHGVVREIAPDVLHAHFLAEHGFYGTVAAFHPYVVTAWGSDVLVEPERDPISRWIVKRAISYADLVTSNNAHMAERIAALGGRREHVHVVTLGADRYFLEGRAASVNLRGRGDGSGPVILSTRAHEPLYNIGEIIGAFERVLASRPDARLTVAHEGSRTNALRQQAASLPDRVSFAGFLDREALRNAMRHAEVFVSIPSSDATSVALLQAMAAGCYPIVADLPSQREVIDDGVNGFRVPTHRPDLLAERISQALADGDLRRRAAELNATIVERRGLNETQMAKMESLYRDVVQRYRSGASSSRARS